MLLTIPCMSKTVTIQLNGGVTSSWVTTTYSGITKAKQVKADTLKVTIFSKGGDMDSAIRVRDMLKSSNLKVVCDTKLAMSAAFFIFLVCDERIIYPRTELMWHQSTYVVNYSLSYRALKALAYQVELKNRIYTTIVAAATKYTWDYIWKKIDYKDWYIEPLEALRNGVATKIDRGKRRTR